MYLQILIKTPDLGFHENPSGGSRVVPYEQGRRAERRTYGRTDMTFVIVAFRNL